MERFTDKNMTESQITEVVELMNGEHGDALKLWTDRNRNEGEGNGLVAGALVGFGLTVATFVGVNLAKATWQLGKAFVQVVKDKMPG